MVAVKVVVLRVDISENFSPAFPKKSFFVVMSMEFVVVAVSDVMYLLFLVAV